VTSADELGERETSDEVLGFAFASGDDTALRAAYDTHGSTIFTFCRRSLPEDRAKDVTQDVFVSAWRARTTFDPSRGTLGGWLMGIAKNRIIDNVRSERRHEDRRSAAEVTDLPASSEIERVGDRLLVTEVLRELPERARTVVHLAYIDDLTHAEIADRTGIPLGTVKSDIRRALTKMRDQLEASR
jgi:RNA polymerase sigma-70 factor (ECF subfamily)